MKAVRIHEFGDESVLRYEDAPDPETGGDDVLIRVRAASVNRGDLGRRAGAYLGGAPLTAPMIIGWDVAGDVVETGAGGTGFAAGQRVVARLPMGGYAELAVAPATAVMTLPDAVSYEQAASIPVAWLTAWVALMVTAQLKAGETVLVQAASSGVGMAGVQIAKRVAGASLVVTTAGTDEKVERAKALGADVAVNYTTADFVEAVMGATNGRGVDVALDMVGGDVFKGSQRALAQGGRLISVGRASGESPEVDTPLAELKDQKVVVGWNLGGAQDNAATMENLRQILDLVAAGKLETVIDKTFPLSEPAAAHRHLAGRNQFGKVILVP